jgi:Tol biopolymer transport system component
MTARDDFDRRLAAWFATDAVASEPEHLLGQVLARTAHTRRRAAWRIPERWIPMSTITSRAAASPRIPIRILALGALLLIALIVGTALLAGSRQQRLPAPFGPAGNGAIVFIDGAGIMTADADGTGTTLLASVPGEVLGGPVVSGDGTRVAYFQYPTTGGHAGAYDVASLAVASLAGTTANTAPIVIDEAIRGASRPTWSPDGRSIAYSYLTTTADSSDRIVVAAADGSTKHLVGDPGLPAAAPTWSPDGRRIAFLSEGPRTSRLMIMNADGSGVRPLTTGTYDSIGWGMEHGTHGVSWSPDGRRIIISAGDGDLVGGPLTRDLYVIDVDGGAPERPVATDALLEYGASFSPDGTRIAYLRGAEAAYPDLIVASSDGSDARVVRKGVSWFSPTWSPDGTRILAETGSRVLALDPATGASAVAIAQLGGTVNDFTPTGMTVFDWQRVAP